MSAPFPELRDRAAYLPEVDMLVVADLHLGRARTAPVETPLDACVRVVDRTINLVDHFAAGELVLAGDVLDAFGSIPPGVSERFEALRNGLDERGTALTIVRGNHDTLLEHLYDGPLHEEVVRDRTVIAHGHRRPTERGNRYVIGHEHPALRIDGVKRPCYLHGQGVYAGGDVLVLPAFSPLTRGTSFNRLNAGDCHGSIVRSTTVEQYRPIVLESTGSSTLTFPPLRDLRSFL